MLEPFLYVDFLLKHPIGINEKKDMNNIFTICYSEEEANEIGHFIMRKGYEGVQNDSYRYCDLQIRFALKENKRHYRNYCFVGVNGCQMVVGKNKKEMRRKGSYKYIEKERMFRNLLDDYLKLIQ